VNAWTAIGVSWMFSERFVAVTTISSSPVAGSLAAHAMGTNIAADKHSKNRVALAQLIRAFFDFVTADGIHSHPHLLDLCATSDS
jgi:hypothetical protein